MSEAQEGEIDPARLSGWLAEEDPPQLIDVREPHEREAGYIEGSLSGGLLRWAAEEHPLSPEGATVANH
jgi:rhodanese-related sulfurtransferase